MSHYDDFPGPGGQEAAALAALTAKLETLETMLRAIGAQIGLDADLISVAPAGDGLLNSQWGNPEIRFAPKDWTGEAIVGRFASDLHPATLRALAKKAANYARYCDEKGLRDDKGRLKSYYPKRDASLYLGWALRLESQGHGKRPAHHPPPAEPAPVEGDDQIPF